MKSKIALSHLPIGDVFRFIFSIKRYGVIFSSSDSCVITDGLREYIIPSFLADNIFVFPLPPVRLCK